MQFAWQSRISPTERWIRRVIIGFVLVTYLLPSLFSAYRAWVQIRSLDLIVSGRELQVGDTIRVYTVSWARTWVYVDLILIQGDRADTLATHEIAKNRNASIDPRWRRDSMTVVVTPEVLAGFSRGPAMVRAKAEGGPQWLRTPPPLIRESLVELVPHLGVGNSADGSYAPRSRRRDAHNACAERMAAIAELTPSMIAVVTQKNCPLVLAILPPTSPRPLMWRTRIADPKIPAISMSM